MAVTPAARARTRTAGAERDGQLAELAFAHSPTPLGVLDERGTIILANPSLCSILDAAPGLVAGHQLEEYLYWEDRPALAFALSDVTGDAARVAAASLRLRGGLVAWMSVSWFATGANAGAHVITLRSEDDGADRSTLAHRAYHDPLTGLANRALFEQRLELAVQRVRQSGAGAALFLIDLDDFKGVNDTLGHHRGDELLVAFAERLRSVTRERDLLCRFGGDEFLVLAEDVSPSDIEPMAARIMSALEEPFALGGTPVSQHASTGVVPLEASFSARSLVEAADIAMYEAKRGGKERFVVFSRHMKDRAVLNFELAQEIRPALARGDIALHYQPLVEVATKTVVGFEALMRWDHPRHGPISPEVFIGLAEQSEFINSVGRHALFEACRALVQLTPRLGGRRPYVAVNIAARHFYDRGFPRLIEEVLTATGLPGERLVIEVTETGALGDLDELAKTTRRLRNLGVATALDDFGTGYSSLSYLPRLTPSIIKIDRSFVSGAPSSPDQVAMLRAVVSLSHTMGARVVAEGVEAEEELELLLDLGCEIAQGFYFSAAVPVTEVPAVVDAIDAHRAPASRQHIPNAQSKARP